jgi:hypothetical protein
MEAILTISQMSVWKKKYTNAANINVSLKRLSGENKWTAYRSSEKSWLHDVNSLEWNSFNW